MAIALLPFGLMVPFIIPEAMMLSVWMDAVGCGWPNSIAAIYGVVWSDQEAKP